MKKIYHTGKMKLFISRWCGKDMVKNMEAYRSTLAPFGNSRGVVFPQGLLKSSKFFVSGKKKIPVEIIETDEGFLVKPIPEWSQERQAQGVLNFLKAVDSLSENERNMLPDGEEFEKMYRPSLRRNETEDEN